MKSKNFSAAKINKMLKRVMASPTYEKAYKDLSFMQIEELRPIRLQLELLKPEMALTAHDIRSTIVVFGSARLNPPDVMRKKVAAARRRLQARPRSRELQEQLHTAEQMQKNSHYYEEARRFAAIATRASQADKKRDFVIVTGGGPGIMEAANRGAFDAGGKSIGLNITLPHEQTPNPYMTPELSFCFHYFAIRKMHFMMRAKAMVAFPGGFGTFDELFETLTLVQTSKKSDFPIILFGREFWTKAVNLEFLAEQGVISRRDLKLFRIVETAEEAWQSIRMYWKKHGTQLAKRRRTLIADHLDDA
ncbi:MAG: TIGR00730 family Rossman fold protein [Elusimicrobiota bacterium]